jgi:BioD-like phosphotransacetylase family protein
MPALQLVASKPLSGKTAVATGMGLLFSRNGQRVRLVRAGSGPAADADAQTFAEYLFAASPGRTVTPDAVTAGNTNELVLVELDAGAAPLSLQALVVVRGEPTDEDIALGRTLGNNLAGSIATRVPLDRTEAVARVMTDGGLRPLALLPEDRTLAAPSVEEIRNAIGADLLYDGENATEVVEDVLIGPVYADPARPHFRRFASKAVLAPFNKTDLHLAAIDSEAACLVITGGRTGKPSPYVVDRARGEATTVLLAQKETPETLAALGPVWLSSRFRGERKAEAAAALIESRLDLASLLRKL